MKIYVKESISSGSCSSEFSVEIYPITTLGILSSCNEDSIINFSENFFEDYSGDSTKISFRNTAYTGLLNSSEDFLGNFQRGFLLNFLRIFFKNSFANSSEISLESCSAEYRNLSGDSFTNLEVCYSSSFEDSITFTDVYFQKFHHNFRNFLIILKKNSPEIALTICLEQFLQKVLVEFLFGISQKKSSEKLYKNISLKILKGLMH